MAHHNEITQMDHQVPLLGPNNEAINDEIEEGRKVEHLIEIDETNGQLVNKSANQIFDERFKALDNLSIKCTTIFKVNVWLRESNPDAYTPKLISIGPYHKENTKLGSMEKYKLLYLRRFLQRKEGLDVKHCISELEKKKAEALKCYQDNLDHDIVARFSEMLLLDGCFVVEFIREYCDVEPRNKGRDKIIISEWMICQVRRDMVLLENQIPFFVLRMLHDMTKQPTEASFLYMVRGTLLQIFPKIKSIPQSNIDDLNAEPFDHLLDVVHMFCRPSDEKQAIQTTNASMQNECCQISFCGTNLHLNRSKETPPALGYWQCSNIPSAT